MVADLSSGKVLLSEDADAVRYPASLTKLMTLYLLFEAVEQGQVTLETKLPVSAWAARQPATRLGVRKGGQIPVEDCISALILRSANDVATVVAEGLEGSEAQFAVKMTATARRLGMSQTVFRNPSGLPDPGHVTSARDMLILAESLIIRFPQYYAYFGQRTCRVAGKTLATHNSFLGRYDGADGLKTGYTHDAGYNLVASVERDGHRLVGVVMGDSGKHARDATMARIMDASFTQLGVSRTPPRTVVLAKARRGHRHTLQTARTHSHRTLRHRGWKRAAQAPAHRRRARA
jgi:D-alanyl-D-alanine carboxypeptidase